MDDDGFRDDNPTENDFAGFIDILNFCFGNFRRVEFPESMSPDDQRIISRSLGDDPASYARWIIRAGRIKSEFRRFRLPHIRGP